MMTKAKEPEGGIGPGEPVALSELVHYQKSSIVSSQLIHKSSGGITIFAFDEGQSLSEHVSSYEALVQVIEGCAEIALNGKWHRVKAGQMILLPANQPHALKAPERFKMVLTLLK